MQLKIEINSLTKEAHLYAASRPDATITLETPLGPRINKYKYIRSTQEIRSYGYNFQRDIEGLVPTDLKSLIVNYNLLLQTHLRQHFEHL